MNISIDTDCCNIQCGEALTIYEVGAIKAKLLPLTKEVSNYRIDLSKIEDIDTAGIQLLLAFQKQIENEGGTVRLEGYSSKTRSAWHLFNLPMPVGLKEAATAGEEAK